MTTDVIAPAPAPTDAAVADTGTPLDATSADVRADADVGTVADSGDTRDASATDGGGADVGRDAGAECMLDLDSAVGVDLPATVTSSCASVALSTAGSPTAATITTASDRDEPVLYLNADMAGGGLVIDFGVTAYDVSFQFDWLSPNPGHPTDERLAILVDGSAVIPALSLARSTRVDGREVRSTDPRGAGRIDVGAVRRLTINLREVATGDGIGVELHSIRFR